jgi:hypothetical protein
MNPAKRIRVSDAEREAVVARLSAATAEGRLTLQEFGDRSHRAYASRTQDELAVLVDDLPDTIGHATPTSGVPSATVPILALICGGASLPLVSCPPIGALLALAGVVLGIMGRRGAARGVYANPGMALAGIICGSIGLVLQTLTVVFIIFA